MAAPAAAPTPALQIQRNLLGSFTRISKGLSVILVGGYLLSKIAPSTVAIFALVPGRTIPFAWNLITCAFFETNAFYLIVDIVSLLFLGRLLEPVWGSKEFIRFVVIVSATTATSTFVLVFLIYIFVLRGWLLYTPISGFHGVVAGLLVAVKQAMPEQELPLPLPFKLRAKWLPSIVVLLFTLRAVLLFQGLLYLPFLVFGTYNAWLYLRFFQTRGEGGQTLKGDPSEDFAFATFFPEPLRPFVTTVATVLGRLLCGRRLQHTLPEDGAEGLPAGPLPGSHPLEASRRRERGARALEERLSKAADVTAALPEKVASDAVEPRADSGEAADKV